ncbi:DUF3021 domain-containing protein [Halobacillus sp. Marseille-Q1614]|uniref:DUF3021 domain-containing protein n=1 Tax=Halobacillus sp. Marseille-Q1614 TaxID=2709134 RepID=UPI00157031B0|nr:DUF3021 domain-containing protein [Halobacillus sp. Marseille-Q1614]
MSFHIVERILIGCGFAAIFTFAALTIMLVNDVQSGVALIWKNMLGSILMGVYFSIASLIFEKEDWSLLKQTALHFILSVAVFYTIAAFTGWVPFTWGALLIGTAIFIAVYFIFWFFIGRYLKKMTADMNKSVS